MSARPTAILARLLGLSQGEVATVLLAFTVALVLTVGGVPPVLRHRHVRAAAETVDAAPAPAAPVADAPTPVAAPVAAAPMLAPAAAPVSYYEASSYDAPIEGTSSGFQTPPPPTGTVARFATVGSPGAPEGIAVADDGMVFVATDNGTSQGEPGPSRILTFDASGAPGRSYAISGQPADHALGVTGLALDGHGGVLALDASTGRVLRIAVTSGAQTTLARLRDVPMCGPAITATSGCEPGIEDDAPLPRAIVVSRAHLYVTDAAQGIVWRLPASGGAAEPWFTTNGFGGGNGLAGIAVDPAENLLVATPEALDPTAALGGAIYRVPVDASGKPGGAALVASFPRGEEPSGIATMGDGSIVAALRGANAVVLLGTDGKEVRRVTGTALDAPTGIAFEGSTLLVTNQAPATRAGWAVLAVGVR